MPEDGMSEDVFARLAVAAWRVKPRLAVPVQAAYEVFA
jgi:hypothetical protein